jgi:hypothetical protein
MQKKWDIGLNIGFIFTWKQFPTSEIETGYNDIGLSDTPYTVSEIL